MLDTQLSRFLLLPSLRLLNTYQFRHAQVFECEQIPTAQHCPKCAQPSNTTYDHVTVSVKDEPLRRSQCLFKIRKRRLLCKHCKKPFTESVDGIFPRRRTTQRLRRAILWAAQKFSSLKDVTEYFHCSSSLIYKAVFEQLEIKMKEYQYPWPKVVGIDEHFFGNRDDSREYFTIFTDFKGHRVREAVLGKKVDLVETKVDHIAGAENVLWAVIDFSTTYRKLVRRLFPDAQIVTDKFHLLQFFTKALRAIRHQTNIDDKKKLPRLRLLLKSRKDLDYSKRQEIDRELKAFPEINEAYRVKEQAMEFCRIKGKRRAEKALERLIERMQSTALKPLQ